MSLIDDLKFDENGLITTVVQDYITKDVLMVAYVNKESLQLTLDKKQMHYYSRSRQSLWLKGETSGHFQNLKGLYYDCDKDCLLAFVEQIGNACHTGTQSCFTNPILEFKPADTTILNQIYDVVEDRSKNPVDGSYTNYLLNKGIDKTLKKVGEEATESVIASKNNDTIEIRNEVADLLYHLSVMLFQTNTTWNDVYDILHERHK